MSFMTRAFLTLSCGAISVSLLASCMFASGNNQSDPTAAKAVPASSPVENAKDNLDRALEQLKAAEAKKRERPENYVNALLQASRMTASSDLTSERVKTFSDSEGGEKYFKQAVDFYVANKWSNQDSRHVSEELWTHSQEWSLATFESIFKKLFEASERPLAEGVDLEQQSANRQAFNLLRALIWRQEPMPFETQKRFLEQAIAMQKSMLKGRNNRLLAPLYDDLAYCFTSAHNLKDAEAKYFIAIAMLDADPVEQQRQIIDLARFYINNNMYAKAEGAWKRAAKLTIEKHLAWNVTGYIDLIHMFDGKDQSSCTAPLFDTLIANGDDFSFRSLDPVLINYIDIKIKDSDFNRAAELIEKRIAAAPGKGKKPGMEDWKIRLSNVYLAQGKTAQSQALFDEVIADAQRNSLPTADWKDARAQLMHNLGRHDEAQRLDTPAPINSSDIILSSPVVVKDKIEFGDSVSVISFNSCDDNDPVLKHSSGGFTRTVPPEGDSSILCLGSVTAKYLQYAGTIYCKSSKVNATVQNMQILPIEHAVEIPDGISAPPQAKPTILTLDGREKILERGDYVLTDLGKLTVRSESSSRPIRIFLQDSPDKKDYELELQGHPLSFRQFQLWYNGDKTIKLRQASGLIYAPNASIELGYGTGFMGVLVAKNFRTASACSVWMDRGVVNRNLTR